MWTNMDSFTELINQSSKSRQHIATSIYRHSKHLNTYRHTENTKHDYAVHKSIREEFHQKCIRSYPDGDPEQIDS